MIRYSRHICMKASVDSATRFSALLDFFRVNLLGSRKKFNLNFTQDQYLAKLFDLHLFAGNRNPPAVVQDILLISARSCGMFEFHWNLN